MASSRYEPKGFLTKRLKSQQTTVVSSLRRENAYLRKTLAEMSRQHAEHNKLVELFLSLESVRRETGLQLKAKEEKIALPSEPLSDEEKKPTDEDSTSDEGASSNKIRELQSHLSDALEKNKQWLEYDQQREAYVRANLARILRLEKQLNEASQSRSQRQHNEDHSNEKERMNQLQQSFEQLLQKANSHLVVIREKNDMTNQNLLMTHQRFKEMEREVEELKQQLQAEEMSRKSAAEDQHHSEVEREQFMLDRHQADWEKIKELERQRDQKYRSSGEEARPPCMPPRDRHTPSSPCSGLNESILECPSCQAEYPADSYRELINHLETCLN
ncbi:centrosomal protein of 55 kDa-like isoform X2 [Sparus aurata]|uniref:centrosomal protein of 55 kDa-like isoform X2 n=1 Tax=Sparus aurata TaxID=8175 RepID=UPI0011C0D2E6|nr:centrosomal protein of 55 kDa-like isoform X2 [Sparus aurata]